MTKLLRTALLALLFIPGVAWSFGSAGAASSAYLKLPMGARGTGMGEAFTGIANDVNAIYYNPAGLTALESAQLQLMHVEGFGGVRYENLGLALPADLMGFDVWGTLGLSYNLVTIENTPSTKENPDGSYDLAWEQHGYMFTAGASVLDLSYAWQATKLYSLGITLKVINEKVDTAEGLGVAFDIGVLTRPEMIKGLSAGLSLQNLGKGPFQGADLPTNMRIGIGYNWDAPFTKDLLDDSLLVDMDFVLPITPVDGVWLLNLGGEYNRYFGVKRDQFASLRLGVRASQDLGAMQGFTVGAGYVKELNGANVGLDYAFVPYGDLGQMHRLAANLVFGPKPRKKGTHQISGFYVFPPPNVQATAGDRQARITWSPQTGRLDGYNLYMSYNPTAGKWTRLNKTPINGTSQSINGLYNGYKVYFAVTTLARKADNLYQESEKSPAAMVTPGAAAALPPLPTK